jgi:hypothetical protein
MTQRVRKLGLSRVGGSPLTRDGIGRGESGNCRAVRRAAGGAMVAARLVRRGCPPRGRPSAGEERPMGRWRLTGGGEWRLAGGDETTAR